MDELIKARLEQLAAHPAMKAANDAIVLAALRAGTSGYQGPKLTDFLVESMKEAYERALTDLQGKMPKEKEGGYYHLTDGTRVDIKDIGDSPYYPPSEKADGFNQCLAEVNTIIEELKK